MDYKGSSEEKKARLILANLGIVYGGTYHGAVCKSDQIAKTVQAHEQPNLSAW